MFECVSEGGSINLNFKDKYSFSESESNACFIASFKFDGIIGEQENAEKLFTISGEFKVRYSKLKEVTITKDFFDFKNRGWGHPISQKAEKHAPL